VKDASSFFIQFTFWTCHVWNELEIGKTKGRIRGAEWLEGMGLGDFQLE
jgi:hypothetical protein